MANKKYQGNEKLDKIFIKRKAILIMFYQEILSISLMKTRIQRQIDSTDRQIDNLVYELYELTPKEIEIVEGKR